MGDHVVVFLGPTLERERANEMLGALYLPPAGQGDLVEIVLRTRPRLIVLIDGTFASMPSVRHKEILWTLSQGTEVVGASSLGALRAAELAGFGMQGYGLIYRWYRATPLADDDEVAVAMTPPELGSRPLSDALINIRVTLRRAERVGLLSAEIRKKLVDMARSTHFLERSYAYLFERARTELPKAWSSSLRRLEDWVCYHAVDQKQRDAVSLLVGLDAQMRRAERRASGPQREFTATEAFIRDLENSGLDIECVLGRRRTGHRRIP
jgi:hypothetical protein